MRVASLVVVQIVSSIFLSEVVEEFSSLQDASKLQKVMNQAKADGVAKVFGKRLSKGSLKFTRPNSKSTGKAQ